MIVIQKLVTHWTKASRGGNGARGRANAGYHYPLPSKLDDDTGFYQHAVFDEFHAFEPQLAYESVLAELPAADLGVEFAVARERLEVFYAWSTACGAPERRRGKREIVLELAIGSWGRFVHNGRVALEDTWVYQQVVYNVAVTARFDAYLFDMTVPAAMVTRVARLW